MRRVARRLVVAGCIVVLAAPVYAHGAESVAIALLIVWGIPAAIAAIVPWHRLTVRIAVAVVPPAAGAAALAVIFRLASQRRGDAPVSGDALIPLVVYGPKVCIAGLAAVLLVMRRRGAA